MKFLSDIDIDLADREQLLKLIKVTGASIHKNGTVKKHNTGVYPTQIPCDPFHNLSAIDYETAEMRGYVKIDLLNVNVYKGVKNEEHLIELMRDPDWNLLNQKEFFEQLIHVGNHYPAKEQIPEPINSIERLAMFLAVIRPAKRHLIGKTWAEIGKTIWEKSEDNYSFKKSHSVAYAHLVVVHANLLRQTLN